MSQLARLRERLQQDRHLTLQHPLDEGVRMVHRPPTPADRDRALAERPRSTQELVPAYAAMLADTLVKVTDADGNLLHDSYGMDLAADIGLEWVQGETRAVDVVEAFYGDCWDVLVGHGLKVQGLAAGGAADPLD